MILIADSGSSKTDWRLIGGNKIEQFVCKGLNPDFHTIETIQKEVYATFSKIEPLGVQEIFFYGSGCSSESRSKIVVEGLKSIFKQADVNVEHDLLGAARAACGKSEGLAGILGTGSNCCVFDGEEVVKEYRTGGFIIGDEGGGVDIGKKIIKAFIEGYLPEDLTQKFESVFAMSVDVILESIYKKPSPNRFLASFSKFAYRNREHPFIAKLLHNSFSSYFEKQVLRYKESERMPLNLVGSIAFYYQEYLRKVAGENGVEIGTILEKPISGLTLYHTLLTN